MIISIQLKTVEDVNMQLIFGKIDYILERLRIDLNNLILREWPKRRESKKFDLFATYA